MNKVTKGLFFGVLTFVIFNLLFLLFKQQAMILENLHVMSFLLSFGLIFSGFVSGKYIRNNGLKYGFFTGILDYLVVVIIILLFLTTKYLFAGTSISDLFIALTQFASLLVFSLIPIVVFATILTSIGGWIGVKFSLF